MTNKAILAKAGTVVAIFMASLVALSIATLPAFADAPEEPPPEVVATQQHSDELDGGEEVLIQASDSVMDSDQAVLVGEERCEEALLEDEAAQDGGVADEEANAPPAMLAVMSVASVESAGDPPASFSGSCNIDWYSTIGNYSSFGLSDFSGAPGSYSVSNGWCLDPTAAEPTGWASYTATLTSTDSSAGKAYYSLYITPPGATDGSSRNEFGLIGYQHVGATMDVDWTFGGYVAVSKVSGSPATTDGNANYSLAGAVYGVYSDNACENCVATLSTDANGNTGSTDLLGVGTYYVREISASPGFLLDYTVYSVSVSAGVAYVTVNERPAMDPAFFTKMDEARFEEGQESANEAQGGATLGGAEYEWRYYEGLYDTVEEAEASGGPTRTWVLKTNDAGRCGYDESYFVSGDALYRNAEGVVTLPLGTVIVVETKAPQGYLLNTTKHIGQVIQLAAGDAAQFCWITTIEGSCDFTDKVITGGLELSKIDKDLNASAPQGDATLYGAVFELYNANEHSVLIEGNWYEPGARIDCLTNRVITGQDGKWVSDDLHLLPYGTYTVKEVWAPQGYALEGVTEIFVAVTEDGVINNAGEDSTAIADSVIVGGVEIQKYDSETGLNQAQGDALLNATFGIVNASAGSVVVNGIEYASGQEVAAIVADAVTGKASFNGLPFGLYYVYEKEAPTGYLEGNPEHKVYFRIDASNQMVDKSILGESIAFGDQVIRFGITVDKAMVGGPLSNAQGIGFAVYDSKGNRVSWKETNGNLVNIFYLDANGCGATPDDALAWGTYTVHEIAETVPANVLQFAISSGTGSNQIGTVTGTENHLCYHVAVENMMKPELDIIKIDGDSFQEEGSCECITVPSVWALERFEDGEWVILQTVLTSNGKAQFDRSLIDRFGTYRLREVASPNQQSLDGWMMPEGAGKESSFEFTFDEDTYCVKNDNAEHEYGLEQADHELEYGYASSGNARITATAINWRYRQIVGHKVDSETGEGIVNTVFTLEKLVGEEWVEVGRLGTDDNGDCIFKGLEFGTYRLTEIYPNPAYMGPEEGETVGQFIIKINAPNGQSQLQVVENKPIHVETTVDKSTIDKTTVGLVYRDQFGNEINNVGNESYKYEVGFSNGQTNTFADEYWVVDDLDMVKDPYNLVVHTLITPTVRNDTDGYFWLLFKTALGTSGEDASDMSFTQPKLHADMTQCDGTMRFDATGWRYFGKYATSEAVELVLSELLDEGDYITSIALCYGAIEPGFMTRTNLIYYVMATHELTEGTVIPNNVTSHISRNWSSIGHTADGDIPQEPDGLKDDAHDSVETIAPFLSFENDGPANLAKTGDGIVCAIAGLAMIALLSVIALMAAWRRNE